MLRLTGRAARVGFVLGPTIATAVIGGTGWLDQFWSQILFALGSAWFILALLVLGIDEWRKKRRPAEPLAMPPEPSPVFRLHPEAVNESGHGQQPAMAYVWVAVEGTQRAVNARGRLIGHTWSRGSHVQSMDIPLAWAQPDNPADPSRKSFSGKARLNVATSAARLGATPQLMVALSAFPLDGIDWRKATFERDVENIIGIEASADNVPAAVEWFRLKWWSSQMVRDGDGNLVEWIFDDARITFDPANDGGEAEAND